ncbi:translation initiation factor IF-2-like [Aquila chrysaetos chrysaetos]|uniref:translation initiation factor IF-2-like n=1 Tax=Aquila chrysaetos chrysaetos TaxID=223781 RepID=UPI001B7D2F6F|nr:translation initiation factor IF-2-like [Aquila chrysaetos chrysaetos]
MGTEAAGEAAGDLQSASPAPAGLTDTEPSGSAVDVAPEEAGHHVPLAPAAREEAKTPASPVFGEQATAAQVESQAPAPHSFTAYAAALQDVTQCIVRDVLISAVATQLGPGQQPVEQWDWAQSMDAVMAPQTPAGPQDPESPLAREPQAEASTAPLVPAARDDGEDTAFPMSGGHQEEASTTVVSQAVHKDKVASSLPPNPPADAGTPRLAPAADDEGDTAASPLARDPRHQVASEHRGDAEPSSSCSDVPEDDPGTSPSRVPPRRGQAWPGRLGEDPGSPSPQPVPRHGLPGPSGAEEPRPRAAACAPAGTARAAGLPLLPRLTAHPALPTLASTATAALQPPGPGPGTTSCGASVRPRAGAWSLPLLDSLGSLAAHSSAPAKSLPRELPSLQHRHCHLQRWGFPCTSSQPAVTVVAHL